MAHVVRSSSSSSDEDWVEKSYLGQCWELLGDKVDKCLEWTGDTFRSMSSWVNNLTGTSRNTSNKENKNVPIYMVRRPKEHGGPVIRELMKEIIKSENRVNKTYPNQPGKHIVYKKYGEKEWKLFDNKPEFPSENDIWKVIEGDNGVSWTKDSSETYIFKAKKNKTKKSDCVMGKHVDKVIRKCRKCGSKKLCREKGKKYRCVACGCLVIAACAAGGPCVCGICSVAVCAVGCTKWIQCANQYSYEDRTNKEGPR